MKTIEKIDLEFDEDMELEFEDWQLEYTFETAKAFVDQVMDELENFDDYSEDEDYIPGVATFGLFCEIVARMGEMGYTQEDLANEIKNHLHGSHAGNLH